MALLKKNIVISAALLLSVAVYLMQPSAVKSPAETSAVARSGQLSPSAQTMGGEAPGSPSAGWTPPDAADIAGELVAGRLAWIDAWKQGLAIMDSGSQWLLADDPRLSSTLEAKAMKSKIALACSPVAHEATQDQAPPLVREWCSSLAPLGWDQINSQGAALGQDMALASAPFNALGPRKLQAPEAERAQERAFIEQTLAGAADPWTVASAVRSLWSHRSAVVTDDWSEIDRLSKFQQGRLRQLAAAHAACLAIGDCSANSVWTVGACSSLPGMVCPAGSNFESLLAQNLSPHERALESAIQQRVMRQFHKYQRGGLSGQR